MRAHTKEKHGMGRRSAIVVGAVLAMIVSVVGWATAGTVAAQTPSCLPTAERTPGPHAFAALSIKDRKPHRRAAVYTDALQFAQSLIWGRTPLDNPCLVHEVDALKSEGFVSGISQTYFGIHKAHEPALQGAHTKTVQLGSPEQAQAELNRDQAGDFGKRFTVPAIPGSYGVLHAADRDYGWRSGVINDVGFTDGDYAYVISMSDDLLPGPSGGHVQKHRRALRGTRQVTNAAINLYNRVHGAAVCP